jgi:hypothetical protein
MARRNSTPKYNLQKRWRRFYPWNLNVSNNPGDSSFADLAASGNRIYTVWQDTSSTDILFAFSTDGGASFSSPINLSNNAGSSPKPSIAVLHDPQTGFDNAYVVWSDNSLGNFEIFYRKSTDAGFSFESALSNISDNAGSSTNPSIAISQLSD